MPMIDMKANYRFRISKHCCFKNGQMQENDLPRLLIENILTPKECVEQIRALFEKTCLPDQNLFFALPKELYKPKFIMLYGEHCSCKLFIEMYEYKEGDYCG
jgi:hypothetical protein